MKPEKIKLIEAAEVIRPMLQRAAEAIAEQIENGIPEEKTFAQVDGLWLGGTYILWVHDNVIKLLEGKPISYSALYQSITLEMLANSNAWSNLRLWARRMT